MRNVTGIGQDTLHGRQRSKHPLFSGYTAPNLQLNSQNN